ncbi:MAG: YveK family protein [Chloroflexota bacterium]
MELDRYGLIVRRRLPLIVAIVALTALVSALYAFLVPSSYKATTELLINPLAPQSAAATYYYPPYYQEQAAQFILDDFIGVIGGTTFSQQVITNLKQSSQADVKAFADKLTTIDDAQKLSKQLTINRINRVLQIQVTASTRNEALAIAGAADQIIHEQGPLFFAALTQATTSQGAPPQQVPTVTVGVSDAPHITLKPSRLHEALFWLLRTAVGLVAALAIVLVLHYFDDRLYDAYDVREMLGLSVLGTVVAPAVRTGAPAERRPAPERERVTVV